MPDKSTILASRFSHVNGLLTWISSRRAKRLLKCVVAYMVMLILAIIPRTLHHLGQFPYIGHVVIIFMHPGRTIGAMLDQVAYTGFGILLGLGIAFVGLILSASAIRHGLHGEWIIFCLVVIVSFGHGYLRSKFDKFACGAILMNIFCTLTMTMDIYTNSFSNRKFEQSVYPALLAIAIVLVCNVVIFPEQSTTRLGVVLTKSLQQAQQSLSASTEVLLHPRSSNLPSEPKQVLEYLFGEKVKLQQSFSIFQNVYNDSVYEFSYSVLPVRDMKYIKSELRLLVARIGSLVGACNAAYTMLNFPMERIPESRGSSFQLTVKRLENPISRLKTSMNDSLSAICNAITLFYNLKLKDKRVLSPEGSMKLLSGQAISLGNTIDDFDQTSQEALRALAINSLWTREEISLLSSFIVNMREASIRIIHCVKQTENLMVRYIQRKGRASIWLPYSERLFPQVVNSQHQSTSSTNVQRSFYDYWNSNGSGDWSRNVQRAHAKESRGFGYMMGIRIDEAWREFLASDNVKFGLKVMTGVSLLLWPIFVPEWNHWCTMNRVQWASVGLMVVIDTSLGQTTRSYAYRALGTFLGGLYGWGVFSLHRDNLCLLTTLIGIACSFCFYIRITNNAELNVPKFSIPSIIFNITMAIVTVLIHKMFWSNKYLLGVLWELLLARDKLMTEIGYCLSNISNMEDFLTHCILERNGSFTAMELRPYDAANKKATKSLMKASVLRISSIFLCNRTVIATRTEPRVRVPFPSKEFEQIIYILGKIVENFDSIVQLRLNYRLPTSEASKSLLMTERKALTECLILSFYVSREALLTKIPLPQWLPSVRTAHQRLIEGVYQRSHSEVNPSAEQDDVSKLENICWNAATGIFEEIIEYVEELLGIVRKLVGVYAICVPPLTRPVTPELVPLVSEATKFVPVQTVEEKPDITRGYSENLEVIHRVQSRKLSMIEL